MWTFNASHGFVEGILRGYKGGLLTSVNYANLTQCETLDGMPNFLLFFFFLWPLFYGGKRTLIRYFHLGFRRPASWCPDLKLQLAATDYGNMLQNEPSPLATSTIAEKCTERLVDDFQYIRNNATGDLVRFLDYMTYQYMIDNVILLITGTLHARDTHELLDRCHPLGMFEGMAALCVATNVAELYNLVLVDTPIGSRSFLLSVLVAEATPP